MQRVRARARGDDGILSPRDDGNSDLVSTRSYIVSLLKARPDAPHARVLRSYLLLAEGVLSSKNLTAARKEELAQFVRQGVLLAEEESLKLTQRKEKRKKRRDERERKKSSPYLEEK